jgi:hypothetical protein
MDLRAAAIQAKEALENGGHMTHAGLIKAKAAIESIDAALSQPVGEAGPQVPAGWIAVDERMPEPGTDCIVWHREYVKGRGPFAKIDRWDEQRECPVSFSTVSIPVGMGWDESEFEDVTHWMPLPASPSVESAAPAPQGQETPK